MKERGLNNKKLVNKLLGFTKKFQSKNRAIIIEALGSTQNYNLIKEIIKFIDDKDFNVRRAVVKEIEYLIDLSIKNEEELKFDLSPIIKKLIQGLNDYDYLVRSYSAGCLGLLKADKALDILIKHLSYLLKRNENQYHFIVDQKERFNIDKVVFALGNLKNIKALEILIKASDYQVYTTPALLNLEPQEDVIKLTKKRIINDEAKSVSLAAEYIKKGLISLPLLIKGDNYLHNKALKSLILNHLKDLKFMIPYLENGGEELQSSAIYSMGLTGDREIIPILMKILKDNKTSIRLIESAIYTIGKLGGVDSESDRNTLKKYINKFKLGVATTLAKSGDFEYLMKIITEDQDTRVNIIYDMLENIEEYEKDKIPANILINEFKNNADADWEIILLLGTIEAKEAFEVLVPFLDYKIEKGSDNQVVLTTIQALAKIDIMKSVKYLIKTLNIDDNYIAQTSAYYLGESGSSLAIQALNKAYQTTSYKDVRRVITHVLKKLNNTSIFYDLLKNKKLNFKALESILMVEPENGFPYVLDALSNKENIIETCLILSKSRDTHKRTSIVIL